MASTSRSQKEKAMPSIPEEDSSALNTKKRKLSEDSEMVTEESSERPIKRKPYTTEINLMAQGKKLTHFQTLALLRKVMVATMSKRTMSEIERHAELTAVEREPRLSEEFDEATARPTSTAHEERSSLSENSILDEIGAIDESNEDVFEDTK